MPKNFHSTLHCRTTFIKMKTAKKRASVKIRIPHTRKPEEMSSIEWQSALRKQIAGDEKFAIKKNGDAFVFTDYLVHSHVSKNTYKVALRSANNSLNFCTCPDF